LTQGGSIASAPCWIGIDPGAARTGVAAADPTHTLAFPLGSVATEPRDTLSRRIRDLLGAREVLGFVIGLPVTERGAEGPAAQLARELGRLLAEQWGLAPVYVDERFSSRAAERSMEDAHSRARQRFGKQQRVALKQSGRLDALAAVEILQSYLDQARPEA
jgi:putative holliday junction resolvase